MRSHRLTIAALIVWIVAAATYLAVTPAPARAAQGCPTHSRCAQATLTCVYGSQTYCVSGPGYCNWGYCQ